MDCEVTFSASDPENILIKFIRLSLRVILGFDIIHAWRQRSHIHKADIVWTHTESQYLAVSALVLLLGWKVPILGQTVWLFDSWPRLNPLQRTLCRRLIKRIDLMTFLSPENMAIAERLFPGKPKAFVKFGIPGEDLVEPVQRTAQPLKVLSVGNDRHRDWSTLVAATADDPDVTLTILSGTANAALAKAPNVSIHSAKTNPELLRAYTDASVVCVPLKPNHHASGITAALEAVVRGAPLIITDIGGLRAYFSDDDVYFVPPGDPSALSAAIRHVMTHGEEALAKAKRVQERMRQGELGCQAYVAEHVRLSREILR
ncbi:MAG TPA: glycosyltransferase [Caulobacteraceae bacterium]|nr:glycosyltransferase [Caulobacteraceae bacterium]